MYNIHQLKFSLYVYGVTIKDTLLNNEHGVELTLYRMIHRVYMFVCLRGTTIIEYKNTSDFASASLSISIKCTLVD